MRMNIVTISIDFRVIKHSTGKWTTLNHDGDKVADSAPDNDKSHHVAGVSRRGINENVKVQIDNGQFRESHSHNVHRRHSVVDEICEMN